MSYDPFDPFAPWMLAIGIYTTGAMTVSKAVGAVLPSSYGDPHDYPHSRPDAFDYVKHGLRVPHSHYIRPDDQPRPAPHREPHRPLAGFSTEDLLLEVSRRSARG